MQKVIDHRPRMIMEVFESLPEGTLAEVINDALYMSPTPSPKHQRISITISSALFLFVNKQEVGTVYCRPIDVYLDETSNAVQPDILFFFTGNNIRESKKGLHGSPSLIVEILSPNNAYRDKVKKKKLYEKFGIEEYWIVDPETRKSTGYSLQGKIFIAIGEFEGCIQSLLLNRKFEF